jgi:hypothetical protein
MTRIELGKEIRKCLLESGYDSRKVEIMTDELVKGEITISITFKRAFTDFDILKKSIQDRFSKIKAENSEAFSGANIHVSIIVPRLVSFDIQ